MKELSLSSSLKTIVDDDVFEWAVLFRWKPITPRRGGPTYAYRVGFADGKNRYVYLHRAILAAPAGMQVDHINTNGLDNRRSNLRLCTPAQNQQHQPICRGNTSGYKGVYLHRVSGLWNARIKFNRREISLGYFRTKQQAARAYDRAALKYFGDFAWPNFPVNQP